VNNSSENGCSSQVTAETVDDNTIGQVSSIDDLADNNDVGVSSAECSQCKELKLLCDKYQKECANLEKLCHKYQQENVKLRKRVFDHNFL